MSTPFHARGGYGSLEGAQTASAFASTTSPISTSRRRSPVEAGAAGNGGGVAAHARNRKAWLAKFALALGIFLAVTALTSMKLNKTAPAASGPAVPGNEEASAPISSKNSVIAEGNSVNHVDSNIRLDAVVVPKESTQPPPAGARSNPLKDAAGVGGAGEASLSSSLRHPGPATGAVSLAAKTSVNGYRFPQGDVLDYYESRTPGVSKAGTHQVKKSLPNIGLDYTVTNFYHTRDGKPGREIPWLQGVKLAEPYRDTTFKVTHPRSGFEYKWQIKDIDDRSSVVATAKGEEVEMMFTKLDLNVVTVTEYEKSTGNAVRELTDTVMVKYVRREIRTLTDEERDELLDSMKILWTDQVKGGNGKELYGEDYQDIWAINRLHFKAGGASSCDHFHAGLGFLIAHSMLSNTFEASLQAVNPKLTLPYWDFTIESSSAGGHYGEYEPQTYSEMLTSKYFGNVDPVDNMVKDGRWGFTEVPRVEVNNPGNLEADVYGTLRSPWNVNNRPYLTRGMGNICGVRVEGKHPWPTCESHYQLSTENNSLYTWVWASMQHPHGGVHAWTGGVLDCEDMHNDFVELVGPELAQELAYYSFIHRKYLYRYGIFKCEEPQDPAFTAKELFDAGKCGCLDYDLEEGDDYQVILNLLGLLQEELGKPGALPGFDPEIQRKVAKSICTRPLSEGDHLQSSSSLDPSFWPTHPTMERLWMYKRLTGTLTDLTWPDTDIKFETTNGTFDSWRLSLWDEDCEGHRGSDVFPYSLTDDGSTFKVMTQIRHSEEGGNSIPNRDLVKLLDPRINSMTYIYDTFEWPHCTADGFDLGDARTSKPNPEVVLWYA